jgi:hypothetical protein
MDLSQKHERTVSIRTTFGTVEGTLASSGMLRLLDDLNVVARNFVTVHRPIFLSGRWARGDGPINVNKLSIEFVRELPGCPPPPGNLRISTRFTRSPVELLFEHYAVQGFLHVPPGGDPMARLNQREQAFVALTSASVLGPEEEFAAPFLAVNPIHVLAACPLERLAPVALPDGEAELAVPLDDPAGI